MSAVSWNFDKPHRCPQCHALTDPDQRCRWVVVTCCKCGARFTRHPWLAWALPKVGVVCGEHARHVGVR